MKLVEAGEKGVSVKLNPLFENKIFTDKTDDDQDVVIVKGRVVRVDQPSPAMGRALVEQQPNPINPAARGGTLLIETDEAPTVVAQPLNERLAQAEADQKRAIIAAEAARLGLGVHDLPVTEGESTDLANKKRISGQAIVPNIDPNASAPATDTTGSDNTTAGAGTGDDGKSSSGSKKSS